MDDFERAIMFSLDPSVTGEIKEKANRYCESVHSTPDAWKFCLDKLFKTTILYKFSSHVDVWTAVDQFQHRYISLSDADRMALRGGLLNWMRECGSTKEVEPTKNKYAQIMALMLKTEYPDQWPTFFNDLLSLLNGANHHVVDEFLRVIKAIDEEVISHELHRSPGEIAQTMRIKDAMREGPVRDLVHVWYEVLISHKASPPVLVNLALQTIKLYVSWIDVTLVVNEKFMGILFTLLGDRNFCQEVCECLYEIVSKGMTPHAKFDLLSQLHVQTIVSLTGRSTEFIAKIGKLVNAMGVELLGCMDAVASEPNGVPNGAPSRAAEVEKMRTEYLAFLFKLLNNESDEVSASVIGFASKYVNLLKPQKPTLVQIEHLELFLQTIRNKAKYPTTFNFDAQDEEEATFVEFRRELMTIYRNILRIIPERAIDFVRTTLAAVSVTPPLPFPESEIALQLFYVAGEVLSTTQETEQFYTQTMISLSSGPLSTYPHQCVMMTYFEVVVRYAKSIPPPSSQPQYLFSFLSAFMDARGLRNPLPSVRARAASCFRNFVRSLKALLFPYLDTIVGLLQDMLVISFEVQKSVPFEDQLNFYESLGLIVGACPDMATQRKHAEALMQPTVSQLEEILVKELYKNDLVSDKPYYTTMLSQLINVIGTFSKGFYAISKDGNPPSPRSNGKQAHAQPPTPTPAPAPPTPLAPSRMIFVRALDLVLRIPVVLPAHEALREITFFFLHRMIDVLGPAILPALPSTLALLLTNSLRTKDVLEFIVLVNQIVSRFKEGVFALINEMLMPFLRRMFELLNPATPPSENSEEQREWMELQKSYYVFLQCVLTNNLAGIFTSPANVPHFTQILGTVMQGLKSKDPTIQKVCVAVLRRMVEEWGGNQTFHSFLFEHIVPRLFETAFSPTFDMNDAATNALAGEIAHLQKLIHTKTGPPFLSFLAQVYLPTLQLPKEATDQFLQQLDKQSNKQFTDFFKNFIRIKNNLRTS